MLGARYGPRWTPAELSWLRAANRAHIPFAPPHLSEYIDFLMTWVQAQLDDEALFPSKVG